MKSGLYPYEIFDSFPDYETTYSVWSFVVSTADGLASCIAYNYFITKSGDGNWNVPPACPPQKCADFQCT